MDHEDYLGLEPDDGLAFLHLFTAYASSGQTERRPKLTSFPEHPSKVEGYK